MLTPSNARRDALGGIIIESRLGAPPGRQHYEREFFPGVEVGLVGWERAHSQGSGTGHESPFAIRYAPSDVNQQFQRLGIERFLRDLFQQKSSNVEVMLTTVTYTHPGTLRLKEIQYRVTAVRGAQRHVLFEAAIEIENRRHEPRVSVHAQELLSRHSWAQILS